MALSFHTSPIFCHNDHMQRGLSFVLSLILAAALCAPSPASAARPSAADLSNSIVISQLYGGGGNTGAPYQNDFVELFNRSAVTVSFTNWSVQYASASSSSWSVTPITATLAPGQYFLIKLAAGNSCATLPCGVALPAPDATGTTPMSASAGKVALVNSATALPCGAASGDCLPNINILDLVGYGSANNYESAAITGLNNTTAAARKTGGCTETDSNSADFAAAAPSPRNTASSPAPCGAGALADLQMTKTSNGPALPGGAATFTIGVYNAGAAPASSITLTDTMPAGFAYASATAPSSPVVSGQNAVWNLGALAAGDGITFTLVLTAPATPGLYTNVVTATTPSAELYGFNNAASASVNVYAIGTTRIHDIQGAAHRSPMEGMTLSGIAGVVTVVRSSSFYMQDTAPDGDDATSEGILVYVGSLPPVTVGDSVVVNGTVNEYRSGGATTDDLTITELVTPSVAVLSHNNPLPLPVILGAGGRPIPALVIEDDAAGDVETSGIFDPASDGLDFYESLEAMLVQVNGAVAAAPTNSYGETPVLADNGISATLRTYRGGIAISASDFNPERVILDDALIGAAAMPDMQVGDTANAPIFGVIDYSFSNYKLLVANVFTITASTSVVSGASGPQLTYSPGRINPTSTAFSSSRKPLAGEFVYNGKTLFAIANHFNSKGGDQPLFGHWQPPLRSSETQRGQQATIVGNFVSQIESLDAQAHIVVCGDLNDFEFSDTLNTLKSGGRLENLTDRLPLNARYTYVYDGNAQTLDHILVSPGLAARTTITNKPVHVNAEYLVANRLSDHDPQWARLSFVKKIFIPMAMKAAQAEW